MKAALLLSILFLSLSSTAQEILGAVTDNKREPLMGVSVQVKQAGIIKGSTVTDFDGYYSTKPLDTGYYDITFSFSGFVTNTVMQIPVNAGNKVTVNVKLENTNNTTPKATQHVYKIQPINPYSSPRIITSEEILSRPTVPIIDMVDSVWHHTVIRQRTTPTYIVDGVNTEPIHLNWRKRFTNRIHNIFHHNKKLQ